MIEMPQQSYNKSLYNANLQGYYKKGFKVCKRHAIKIETYFVV